MAFEIGQRVTSRFTGDGIIISDMLPRDEAEPNEPRVQMVEFESPALGTRPWAIYKLDPVGDLLDGGDDAS